VATFAVGNCDKVFIAMAFNAGHERGQLAIHQSLLYRSVLYAGKPGLVRNQRHASMRLPLWKAWTTCTGSR